MGGILQYSWISPYTTGTDYQHTIKKSILENSILAQNLSSIAITLTVTNWKLKSNNVTLVITVLNEALPLVSIQGTTTLSIDHNKYLEIGAIVTPSGCEGLTSGDFDFRYSWTQVCILPSKINLKL